MQAHKNRPIIVLGGDGYLGWPLTLRLARRNPDQLIISVDNLLRRKMVTDVGSESLVPIASPTERLTAARRIYGVNNIEFRTMEVNSDALPTLIREVNPIAVYHLAQQCSAPYSMHSSENALFTLRNNEEGNMRLLWAIREFAADCHLIKLGTFGEYAKSGLDIAEGYFRPTYKGKTATRDVPYPRQSDDFYHASKINDTNYISIACRSWGLRITDIMQSTIFGVWTPDIGEHDELHTRLDYDEFFGTVVNRFLAQAVSNTPLTVYGSGHQRTGLMSLNDSITSLASLWKEPPALGEHRVINHLTEDSFSINELADCIKDLGKQAGLDVKLERGVYDPRSEQEPEKLAFRVERHHVEQMGQHESLTSVVATTLKLMKRFKSRINTAFFAPQTQWRKQDAPRNTVVNLPGGRTPSPDRLEDDLVWENFRAVHFPYRNINLNPGTLGSPSQDVLDSITHFQSADVMAYPLLQYGNGRNALYRAVDLARELWPSPEHRMHITGSASQCSNLLALSFARRAAALGRPIKVLATAHEHIGGLGAFESLPEFAVQYLPTEALQCKQSFSDFIDEFQPDICFFSHIAYDSGQVFPIEDWAKISKQKCPDCDFIADVSQSLGLLSPPFSGVDIVFGSCHKWLFGPRGTGLMWTTADFQKRLGGLYFAGDPLLSDPAAAGFSPAGGQDFAALAGVATALQLHQQVGRTRTRQRSRHLASKFRKGVHAELESRQIDHSFLSTGDGVIGESGVLTVQFEQYDPYPLYQAMNERGVHCKCIKDLSKSGQPRQLLRFGVPYYETEARLEKALSVMNLCLQKTADTKARKTAILTGV
ncbi:aminotransferase class V-fold PLP-dependent enzyme [uncultured Zhongshania sp.]|uniref:aminotransferase class V-fold PLP-dependent enzyme n=1 Tax=uncultured Zhongshania sp. TaxID=1642288 RepID=UPI0030D972F4|tara:strand:+ start:1168 stop:3636 length:2469 start_codon:yes stop_codon:yes gene_type:complete